MLEAPANFHVRSVFWRVICSLLFQLKSVSNSFLQNAEVINYCMQNQKKSMKIKVYCMRQVNTFLQLAKGSLIASVDIAKGYKILCGANCMQKPIISCKAVHVSNIPLGFCNFI
jgi:hypothetical protein